MWSVLSRSISNDKFAGRNLRFQSEVDVSTKKIKVLTLLLLCFAQPALASEGVVKVSIADLRQQVKDSIPSDEGLVLLKFQANNGKSVRIPFAFPIFIWESVIAEHSIKILSMDDGSEHVALVDCAIVKYDWYGADNKVLLHGVAELSDPMMELNPQRNVGFANVALRLPTKDGTYRLRVAFDNAKLERLTQTRDSFDLSWVFFKSVAESQIVIKDFRKGFTKSQPSGLNER